MARPHWHWVVGFLLLIALVSILDSLFTYLSKQIVDQGIVAGDRARLLRASSDLYAALIFVQAASVFGFIYLAGILGERIQYDLRKTHVRPPARAVLLPTTTARRSAGSCRASPRTRSGSRSW